MARIRFRRPKIAVLMSEVIGVTVWLYLGDTIIDILDGIIGDTYPMNVSGGAITNVGGCTNDTVFEDAFQILGVGYDCGTHAGDGTDIEGVANTDDGLLGVIGLVMVVMILMNFITYR